MSAAAVTAANAIRSGGRALWPARVRDRVAAWLAIGTGLGFALLVGVGVAALLRVCRIALPQLPAVRPMLLLERALAGGYAASAILLVLGSLTTAVSLLFLSDELTASVSLPIPHRRLLRRQLVTAILSSAAPTLLLALPAIAVGAAASPRPLVAGVALTLSLLSVVSFAGLLGCVLSLVLVRAVLPRRARLLAASVSAIGLSIALVAFRGARPERLLDPLAALELLEDLGSTPAAPRAWDPTWWAAQAALGGVEGRLGGLALSAALFTGAWILVLVASAALAPMHYHVWQLTRESDAPAAGAGRSRRPARGLFGMLLRAEGRSLLRDASTPAQLGSLTAVLVLYLLNLRLAPAGDAEARDLVTGLQTGLALFLVSALSLRFAYPAVSSDGRSALLLRSYPLSAARHLAARFAVRGLPALALSLLLVVATVVTLRPGRATTLTSLMIAAAGGLAIPALNLALGALFPRYAAPNAVSVALGPGGLFALTLSTGLALAAALAVSGELLGLAGTLLGVSLVRAPLALLWVLAALAAAVTAWGMAARALARAELSLS